MDREQFDRLITELRPSLHRYCARMTGSVIDGEDALQDALLKATEALPVTDEIANPEAWLFRIAHNAALDLVRYRARRQTTHLGEELEKLATGENPTENREIARAGLRTFMRLVPAQRSSVILRDVLGYSVEEISAMTGSGIPSVKSALQRGRVRLRAIAREPDDVRPPALSEIDRARLIRYVDQFNARDFDAVRQSLADDVRLDLVSRLQAQGRGEVGEYFHRYALAGQWRFAPGLVEHRPAMLVFDRHDPSGQPVYFVLLEWAEGRVARIRDFLFARYVLEDADPLLLG